MWPLCWDNLRLPGQLWTKYFLIVELSECAHPLYITPINYLSTFCFCTTWGFFWCRKVLADKTFFSANSIDIIAERNERRKQSECSHLLWKKIECSENYEKFAFRLFWWCEIWLWMPFFVNINPFLRVRKLHCSLQNRRQACNQA